MPAIGKEQERQTGVDQLAAQEVQGYIDRVEKQAESSVQTSQSSAPPVLQPQIKMPITSVPMTMTAPKNEPVKIVLPLDRGDVERGMHAKLQDSVRWLSEWCVMMIKKYPGRVFYLTPTNQ